MTINRIPAVLAVLLAAMPALAQVEDVSEGREAVNAIVKLDVETSKSDICCPWANFNNFSTGSGVVVADGRILTCAHCVADASYIRVRKHNEDALYHGSVEFIDNDADLAIVRVDEPEFMADIAPMEIGDTPRVQDDVLAVGYPVGGEDISYTRGIVSRIEDIEYAHSLLILLGIQVDAAINPGNSGGPVLDMVSGKIAGIAFQGVKKGEALGYIIPPDIIRHFLRDVEDGRVDGFSDVLFSIGTMESAAKRRYCRMQKGMTGVAVDDVDGVLGEDSIRTGDVILEIDGMKISNSGRIRLADGAVRSLYYPLYTRQIGEEIPVKVLRDGLVVETAIPVAKKNYRVRRWMYDTRPDYLVYGGFVFTTASIDYILHSNAVFHDAIDGDREFEDDEPVVISYCFSDKSIEGYAGGAGSLVRKVNGEKVRNLRHLAELLDACREGFVRLDVDRNTEYDLKIVVDAKEMREATQRVMKRNLIPGDRSEDLRKQTPHENGREKISKYPLAAQERKMI